MVAAVTWLSKTPCQGMGSLLEHRVEALALIDGPPPFPVRRIILQHHAVFRIIAYTIGNAPTSVRCTASCKMASVMISHSFHFILSSPPPLYIYLYCSDGITPTVSSSEVLEFFGIQIWQDSGETRIWGRKPYFNRIVGIA